MFLIIIIVAIFSVICWYKRIGICAKLRKRRRPRTTITTLNRAQDNEIELNTVVCNPCTLSTTSNTDTIQSTSTSCQNTLPSTTVNTTPHYTGNTLPNVVPQSTPNPYVQHVTLAAQGGDNPSHYCYVPPTNAAFKDHQPTKHLPPPYSEVAYPSRQQMDPNTSIVPGDILPQQFPQKYMSSQQRLYVQQTQQMSLQSNGSNTTQNIDSPVTQEPVAIQDTPTQNPPPQNESYTPITGSSTTQVPRENDTSKIDVSSTSNPTPQGSAIIVPPITTITTLNEAHGAGTSAKEIYKVVGGPAVNDDTVYEVVKSGGDTPSHSDLYDYTD